ncbi:MAG: hypothetical protein BAJALOKI2v1_210007 [Promethearchaeota archaeon]|nr:MAG: hypothetical protein BAJALOKI2v1_210007 [Candidatus Lokiarchaeota archaeon]
MNLPQIDSTANIEDQKTEERENIIKFIHASDIHLGAHQFRNDERANDFIYAFKEILALAKFHSVDFIILAGDVFTSLEILPEKLNIIVDLLKKFIQITSGQIPIIAIEGNHDIRKFSRGAKVNHGQSWLKFLNKLGLIILLDADLESDSDKIYKNYNHETRKGGKCVINNISIYGNHYIGQNPVDYIPKIYDAIDENDNYKILIQHFGIKGQMENVPGIKYKDVLPLKKKIDYLALGHFHKQFTIESWIFNPGSSEAACSVDSSYKRGIFLTKINLKKKNNPEIKSIHLRNREHIWKHFHLKFPFKNPKSLAIYLIHELESVLNNSQNNHLTHKRAHPILYLRLTGLKPYNFSKKYKSALRTQLMDYLNLVDVKIYQKFEEPFRKIDIFI